MDKKLSRKFSQITNNPREATKYVSDVLFYEIYPLMLKIRNKIHTYKGVLNDEESAKAQEVYTLCASQISKCFQTLLEIFKVEYHNGLILQESRHYATERLSWCINRLQTLEQELEKTKHSQEGLDTSTTSILTTPMYFVNWIDYTFEVLTKLANLIYKTDYKDTEEIYIHWKDEMVDCISTLHISLDELLLSAMTLAKYCLPADQHIIKARCQVVLRETQILLSELIKGDPDTAFRATADSLKLPIMPSNINVLIDVLKDVLYILETTTNTALLSLLVHCFSNNTSPVDILEGHIKSDVNCSCHDKSSDIIGDCDCVKEFDMYNERLLQIGSFAVSCSSDKNRILSLRSALASVEALDPYLVPGLLLSPDSHHARLLVHSWKQEVQDIRDSVFLIVDPAAFAEKSKQIMHQKLVEILQQNKYNNSDVCQVINIGCVVHDFFSVYISQEPDALTQHDNLIPLIADLNKVQKECKIVSNMIASEEDFLYEVCNKNSKDTVSYEQLVKRLKLLYTLVNRTNSLMHPIENDDQLFACEVEEPVANNITHNVYNPKNIYTYVNSQRKHANMSSIFARTANIRSPAANFPMSTLTKHLKAKKCEDLSFSMKIDEFFNLSDDNNSNYHTKNNIVNKNLESLRERSMLYNYSPNKKASLRKAVLSKHWKTIAKEPVDINIDETNHSKIEGFIDEETQLQITEILNQMDDMTTTFSGKNLSRIKATKGQIPLPAVDKTIFVSPNVLRINVNEGNTTITRHIWNIPVNASTVEMPLDDSVSTTKSSVTTLERIKDIKLVENKLSNLKAGLETSL